MHSNACKFTPSGGKLVVTTKLVIPCLPPEDDPVAGPLDKPADVHTVALPGLTEKEDTDAPSSTAGGSEGRVGQLGQLLPNSRSKVMLTRRISRPQFREDAPRSGAFAIGSLTA